MKNKNQTKENWEKDRQKFIDALIWCSGSDDFQVGGKARKGWEKICLPLLKDEKNEPERDYSAEGEAEMEARDKYEAEMEDQAEKETYHSFSFSDFQNLKYLFSPQAQSIMIFFSFFILPFLFLLNLSLWKKRFLCFLYVFFFHFKPLKKSPEFFLWLFWVTENSILVFPAISRSVYLI